MGDMDDIIKDFLVESYENLDQLDRHLVALEKEPTSHDLLSAVFRAIHTIKGTCGFLGFAALEAVAHVGENLLSRLRDGQLQLNQEITTALLAMVDAIRRMLSLIEATGQDGGGDYADLIALLTRLQEPDASPPDGADLPKDPGSVETQPAENATSTPVPTAALRAQTPPVAFALGDLLIQEGLAEPEDVERALAQQAQGDPRKLEEILVNHGVVKEHQLGAVLQTQKSVRWINPELAHAHPETRAVTDRTVRVDVGLLDKLMNLVGELVLVRNQVLQCMAEQKDRCLVATAQRLNLITSELQEEVMKTRMQPIGNLWSKLPRIVRDVAVACGKQVRVEMEGKETGLDKTIIEALKDPLTHMVRNAVDHGIESPEKRAAASKPPEGLLFLKADHEGGQINIEIRDDGGGVDFEKVKQKALAGGLISTEYAARMTELEAANLIFLPGFSTAEQVTNVSGRGVGMDVVKTNIEKVGGTIDLQSKVGCGSTFKIKIPLTLAIIPALMVTSGGERYAVPQGALIELVRLEGEEARTRIEMIHGAPVYRLRGRLLPIVYLNRVLGLSGASRAPSEGAEGNEAALHIIVLHANKRQFGLVVDKINDTQEIVVKPLGKLLRGLSMFAGATILGDGKVALILEAPGLAQHAGVLAETQNRLARDKNLQAGGPDPQKQRLLLFRVGETDRMAVPLSQVARLEEFSWAEIEYSGAQEVVQYRGRIMPLIRLSQALGVRAAEDDRDPLQVVVYSHLGCSVGLVVGRILDIVEETALVQRRSAREGVLGSVVIQQQVMDLIDIPGIIRLADPLFFEHAEAA